MVSFVCVLEPVSVTLILAKSFYSNLQISVALCCCFIIVKILLICPVVCTQQFLTYYIQLICDEVCLHKYLNTFEIIIVFPYMIVVY